MRGAREGPGRSESAKHLGEEGLIGRLRGLLPPDRRPLLLGPGDDAALLAVPPGEVAVLTIDTLEEGVHFELAWMPPFDLGRRAQIQSLSDIAAMGARPLGAVVALSMPPGTPVEIFDSLVKGLVSAAEEFRCPLAGGNLARRADAISISTATLGSVAPGSELRRSAARPGDELWVTGAPGSAAAGLHLLMAGKDPARDSPLSRKFLEPVPRIDEAAFLKEAAGVRAAIDLSDGVRKCAALLAEESRVAIELDATAFPAPVELASAAARQGTSPASLALDGGEDFELLFTAPAGAVERVLERFERKFSLGLAMIGSVKGGSGLVVLGDPGGAGFEHF